MRKIILLFLSTLSLSAFATDDMEALVKNAYSEQNNTAFVACSHPFIEYKENSIKKGEGVVTSFLIKDTNANIQVDKNSRVELRFENSHEVFTGFAARKGKYISWRFKRLNEAQKVLYNQLELDKLNCMVEVFKALPIKITNSKLHINMHPHRVYDQQSLSTPFVNEYLADQTIQNIIFLDNYDYSYSLKLSPFVDQVGENYWISKFSIPEVTLGANSEVYAASAGHAVFSSKVNILEVVYTGGNINYCILNNFRRLTNAFIQGSTGGVLTIKFDVNALMAQKGSWMWGARFPGRKYQSIYVKEYIKTNPDQIDNLAETYFDYMTEKHFNLLRAKELFGEVKLSFKSRNFFKEANLKGKSSKKFQINFEFINE